MTVAALRQVLDELEEGSWVEGTTVLAERFAIALPDGDVGALDDDNFVGWLLEHAEPAPFGDKKQTKVDPKVRHAQRLVVRGKAEVHGFDPAAILGEIEAVLSPSLRLAAKLVDVIVYPQGGKFERHKDTPRSPGLVGTLVVGLPVAHEGGDFVIDDGSGEHVCDWSRPQDRATLRWVALFSDVDHAVKPVTAGARVTLVYALLQTDTPRADPKWDARVAKVRAAATALARQETWPVMLACSRHVITEAREATQSIEALRGVDRDVAGALVDAGYDVVVRACLAASPVDETRVARRFPNTARMYGILRLDKPLTPKVIAGLGELVAFEDDASDDEGEDLSAYSIQQYLLDEVPLEQWVIRKTAQATLVHEALCSDTGYFGNEAYGAYLYTLAALEVSRPR